MRFVVLPQAVKNILPAIGNEMIALLKETAVAGYVAVQDLTRAANLIRNNTYDAVNPLLATGHRLFDDGGVADGFAEKAGSAAAAQRCTLKRRE